MATKKKTALTEAQKITKLKDEVFTVVMAYWENDNADVFDDLSEPLNELQENNATLIVKAENTLPKKTVTVTLTEAQIALLKDKFENDNLCLSDSTVKTIKAALKAAK